MANLTIKNVPEELYLRLKEKAVDHRRSLNQEAIAQLEAATTAVPDRVRAFERAAEFRAELQANGVWFTAEEIDAFIKDGRR